MPFKPSPGAAYKCDIRFAPPIGRISRSLGTTDRNEYKQRVALLRDLHAHGQHQVLAAFRDGAVSIEQLLAIKRERRLTDDGIQQELTLRAPLWDTIDDVVENKLTVTHATRKTYRSWAACLAKSGHLADDATLRDLADVPWAKWRAEWKGAGASWNQMRSMVSRVLTIALGDLYHPFRREVVKKIQRLPQAKFRDGFIDLPIFLSIVKRMPAHSQAGAWTLLLTGLRSGTEYMALGPEHLDHHGHFVSVPGTKTDGSMDRVYVQPQYWSWIIAGVPAPVKYKWLAAHFKRAARKAGHPKLSLAHLRNLHGLLPLDRGASVSDVQSSMRHSTPAMTLRYTRQLAKGRVASVLGDALSEAGAEPILAMPGPLAAAVAKAEAHTARVAPERDAEAVSTPADLPRRPGRPKGKVYEADLECIRRRQGKRLAAQARRLSRHLDREAPGNR